MEAPKVFSAWDYFVKIGKDEAQCRECPGRKIIKYKGSSTSGLIRHLQSQHDIKRITTESETAVAGSSSSSTPKSQPKVKQLDIKY